MIETSNVLYYKNSFYLGLKPSLWAVPTLQSLGFNPKSKTCTVGDSLAFGIAKPLA
jgi:hypothetical protein